LLKARSGGGDPATLVIGTAPGEWVTERARLRFGFEAVGVRIEPGEPVGYEEGALGWVVDQPTFYFPDGSSRRLVHMHVSVGVPDEEVAELQQRWSSTS
jgi:hypothetical protein